MKSLQPAPLLNSIVRRLGPLLDAGRHSSAAGDTAMSYTCDAGSGCKITCANGCYAMISGGVCYKGCSKAEIEQQKVQLTAESKISLCVKELTHR